MALTRPAELRQCRIRLAREPAAAAAARGHVRAVIRDWKIPVDPDIAVLLTSDLVTNAIMHRDRRDRHPRRQVLERAPAHRRLRRVARPADGGASRPRRTTGPGLALVAALAAAWGCFHTPAGKAVYFTLTFQTVRCPTRKRQPNQQKGKCEKHYAQEPAENGRVRVPTGSRAP